MKFGFRIPFLTKRIAARTSIKRVIRHNLGFKALIVLVGSPIQKKQRTTKSTTKHHEAVWSICFYWFHLVSLRFQSLPAISKNQIQPVELMSNLQSRELANSERDMFVEK